MGLACLPCHLSGSQSSLASEAGMGPTDPQKVTPTWLDPKGPTKYPAAHSKPPTSAPPSILPPQDSPPFSLSLLKLESGR